MEQDLTIEQVIARITSTPKYYAGICEQSYASNMIKALRLGTCKPETERAFLKLFGFERQAVKYKKL